jgi:hypothetical protein
MTDINLKTLTPDTSLPTTGFLFGADSQASTNPSVYGVTTAITAILGNAASSDVLAFNSDTILARDAANTFAQRNGVNVQTFRVYNTYTDASNYERGKFSFVSNELQIGTEAAGTGTARTVGIYQGATQIAQFSTNQIYINRSLIFQPDNTYDIGAVSATRPRSVYVGTSITPGAGVLVANLPTPTTGMVARVTNALAPAIGTTVAGGGAAYALVNYNGANWTVIGI